MTISIINKYLQTMAELAIIAIVIISAIIIGKANHSDALIWRLLFCFSISMCVSIAFLYVFNNKPKAYANNVTVMSKAVADSTQSHTVFFDQMEMEEDARMDTVGQENVDSLRLTKAQVLTNMLMTPMLGAIVEHIIFDSS